MPASIGISELIFGLTLLATFSAALIARAHSNRVGERRDGLAGRQLNRWLIGLSAGTTANSGFIVTAAVGLGYSYGLQWIMLPLSWLIGDLIFWYLFPARINAFGHASGAATLSELLTDKLSGRCTVAIAVTCSLIILICLTGYTSAQWIAGQKFLSGAFGLPSLGALTLFALIIVAYSSLGGFRGSVYTDTFQAVVRIIGTAVALVAVAQAAASNSAPFWTNIAAAGPDFLRLFPSGVLGAAGFIAGFAAAAIGFGLGQPQIVSRYLAGKTPEETRAAWSVYVTFVQATWLSMTGFGVLLRGVIPNLADPETGLSVFFQENVNAVATGLIVADVFATIASTSNGLLVAMAQTLTHDLAPRLFGRKFHLPFTAVTLALGLLTMIVSALIHGTVVSLALSSVSMMGAGLAAAVMIKVAGWRHSAISLLCSIGAGVASAALWKYSGLGAYVNEAGVGMAAGLGVNLAIGSRTAVSKSTA